MAKRPTSPTSTLAVADRLRLTREAMKLKQRPFAERVGITPQAWNNYERGVNRISLDWALKVCIATGASLDWIYRGIASQLPNDLATEISRLERERRKAPV